MPQNFYSGGFLYFWTMRPDRRKKQDAYFHKQPAFSSIKKIKTLAAAMEDGRRSLEQAFPGTDYQSH